MALPPAPVNHFAKELLQSRVCRQEKLTRRDRFLAEIDNVTPWGKLHKVIEPFYPKVENAVYDSQSIRAFVGIDLGRESAPDATTLLKF
jgi:IS5 family transposase